MRNLDGDDVELEEFDRICGPVVTRADVWLELVRPDDVALLASEGKTPGVVDRDAGGPDVLASLADVIDGAIMIFVSYSPQFWVFGVIFKPTTLSTCLICMTKNSSIFRLWPFLRAIAHSLGFWGIYMAHDT
jgi:hypothetical protein